MARPGSLAARVLFARAHGCLCWSLVSSKKPQQWVSGTKAARCGNVEAPSRGAAQSARSGKYQEDDDDDEEEEEEEEEDEEAAYGEAAYADQVGRMTSGPCRRMTRGDVAPPPPGHTLG